MKIARWSTADGVGEGFVIDARVVAFPDGKTVADVLAAGLEAADALFDQVRSEAGTPLADVALLTPLVPAAVRDFAVFEEHVEGMSADANGDPHVGEAWYEQPVFYFTNPHQIFGPGAQISPPWTETLDYELEVAVVIGGVAGSTGANLSVADAEKHIFGYTIMNDWSARDIQIAEMQNRLGPAKGKDFATSLGPWIVTPDELTAHRDDEGFLALRAEVYVNDVLTGADLLSNMSWSFPELISYAARASRVVPGDVLGSGTTGNGGCLAELWGLNGGEKTPPPLEEGDVVRMVVDGLGELVGTVGSRQPVHELPRARRRVKPRARTVA